MLLTIFVCAKLIGAGAQCHALPMSDHLAKHEFSSFEECQATGFDLENTWLAAHEDFEEGGIRCSTPAGLK